MIKTRSVVLGIASEHADVRAIPKTKKKTAPEHVDVRAATLAPEHVDVRAKHQSMLVAMFGHIPAPEHVRRCSGRPLGPCRFATGPRPLFHTPQ